VAEWFGIPVKNYLRGRPDGKDRRCRAKVLYSGSAAQGDVDNTNPLATACRARGCFFDSSPVFRLEPDAELKHTGPVAWFSGGEVLDSGWAWGQHYLDGGTAVAEASVGKAKWCC